MIFDQNIKVVAFLGPFLVDVDNSDEKLDDAQAVTKEVVTHLIKELGVFPSDLRIFFSGRKGFNVEVRPQALGINGSIPDQIRLSSNKLGDIIAVMRNKNNMQNTPSTTVVSREGTVIDRIYGDRFGYKLKHPYIRLHHSVNKWIRNDGSKKARVKIELTIEQLWSISAAKITSKAEELAQMHQLT